MTFSSRYRSRRSAFTLAEMLMSIVIIVVLIAIAAVAVLKFMDLGPYNATTANLAKLKGALDTQWTAVVDKAKRDTINVDASQLGVTSLSDGKARQKFVESRIAQAFPISFAEVMVTNKQPAVGVWKPYQTYLSGLGVTSANAASYSADFQQGVLLLMILERGPMNAGLNADTLGTSLAGQIQHKTPSATANACLDAWGRPLYFSRNFENKANTLGILSAGPNGRTGAEITLGNASTHTLGRKPDEPVADYDDNVMIPDNR